jgi:hypothetical protein
MPEILDCPQCERKLRVPDELLGCAVTCPTCGVTFTAPAAAASGPVVPDSAEDYAEEAQPSRRHSLDLKPHRGTLILVLGILSIVFVFCGILGPVAWIMGSTDLKEIRAGRMDSEGQGTTNAGRICGIVGTVLNLVMPVCCGIPFTLVWVLSYAH